MLHEKTKGFLFAYALSIVAAIKIATIYALSLIMRAHL